MIHVSDAQFAIDPRKWVVDRAKIEGVTSTRALADELAAHGVHVSHVWVWRALKQAGVEPPGSHRKPKPKKVAPYEDWILERVRQNPDETTRGLADALAAQGIEISCKSVERFLRDVGAQSHGPGRRRKMAAPDRVAA